jgi:hypothetical protein
VFAGPCQGDERIGVFQSSVLGLGPAAFCYWAKSFSMAGAGRGARSAFDPVSRAHARPIAASKKRSTFIPTVEDAHARLPGIGASTSARPTFASIAFKGVDAGGHAERAAAGGKERLEQVPVDLVAVLVIIHGRPPTSLGFCLGLCVP